MNLEEKLRKLLENHYGDIEIVNVSEDETEVEVLLPYDNASYDIELDGDTDEEKIASFKFEINDRLEEMIGHLEHCKFNIHE